MQGGTEYNQDAAGPLSARGAHGTRMKKKELGLAVSFPSSGRMRIESERLFANPKGNGFEGLVERLFDLSEVQAVTIDLHKAKADIQYEPNGHDEAAMREKIARALARRGNGGGNGLAISSLCRTFKREKRPVSIYRQGDALTTWQVKHELPGRIRFKNEILFQKKDLCQSIERELLDTLGVDNFNTNPLTCTVLVYYNPCQITKDKILMILDAALAKVDKPSEKYGFDADFAASSIAVLVSAVGQYAVPALLPVGIGFLLYASVPTYTGAYSVVFKERRVGVDILDAIVITSCLLGGQIFVGTIMSWCLALGRKLLKKTKDDSRKMLLTAFSKRPRFVWIYKDGVETEVPMDSVGKNDTIVVRTGELIPVDGIVNEGFGMVDQHLLTGESTPVEKGVGERVFASTVVLAGKIFVSVEKAGSETASAQITKILNDTIECKLDCQTRGERFADMAVLPTLALGAAAMSFMGPQGGMAVVNCDLGTGIRIAAPLGTLTYLNLCAQKGILVKDGRALEILTKVDTILFDKTGTLTRERPEVGRVLSCNGQDEGRIIQLAAAAEQRFSHPIAKAIQERFEQMQLPMPETDSSSYSVGYGIKVNVDGRLVRVGSARFLRMEGIEIPASIDSEMQHTLREGNSMILVGVDEKLGGAIELQASHRPEIQDIITGLRQRGIKELAILSGDHEEPTRKMAEMLGMDRYFAEVLPQDKAGYVELLQKEGRTVCFVGDGINDSIALKKANVSISLRGASGIAMDTANILFMQESLSGLCEVLDIAKELERNIRRSWQLIVVPNSVCIAGVFALGFGLWTSVLFNNATMVLSFLNGVLPLRKVLELQAEKALEMELALARRRTAEVPLDLPRLPAH